MTGKEVRTFPKQHLLDLGVADGVSLGPPSTSRAQVLECTVDDTTRWSVVYDVVFRLVGMPDDEALQTCYQRGATEMQEESPWEYETEVECTVMHRVTKTVTVWE